LTAGLEDFDAAGHEFWGVPSTSQRVLAIAGLIELALTAGYVDFTEDESRVMTTILEGPFRAFQDNVVSPANEAATAASAASLHLFSRFMDRLANGNLTATDRKGTLADVFESYANLTSYVWSDSVFHQFLLDTHGTSAEWIRDDDLALLVTPRHFASAVATGFIGEKPAPGAEGGLAAMTYLDWLSAIVASAGDDPLGDDIVRHARWAHSVDRIATRIEQWAEAMSEWPETGQDIEGEAEWRAYGWRVFKPLSARQATLAVPEIVPQSYWGASSPTVIGQVKPFDELRDEVNGLKAQGRIGGARRLAAVAASRLYAALSQPGETWVSNAEQLVTTCQLIADIGDVDLAAAYVAPIRPRVAREIKDGASFPLEALDEILLKSRTLPVDANHAPVATSTAVPPGQFQAAAQQTELRATWRTHAGMERTDRA
jgi:hypothetical protein